MNDLKLLKWLVLLLALPVGLAFFSGDRFRYTCQDPNNWDKSICQKPQCDVTRTCPEHVFKGQRDPRLGAPDGVQITTVPTQTQGATCAR